MIDHSHLTLNPLGNLFDPMLRIENYNMKYSDEISTKIHLKKKQT